MPLTRPAGAPTAALDIGGTHISSAVVDADFRILHERRSHLDPDAVRPRLLDRIAQAAHDHVAEGERVAIAIPGPFDYARGIGDFRGVEKFAHLQDVDIRSELAQRWGLTADSLRFINDAEAFGLGEWARGAGSQVDRCVVITLGTGVGTAFIDEGRCVTSGAHVPPDGNIHNEHVDHCPLEEHVSRKAIIREYRERTGLSIDVAQIARAARMGDKAGTEVLETAMRTLARTLAPWLAAFRPRLVVVGGSMAGSDDLLLPPLCAELDNQMRMPPDVFTGLLGSEHASLIGAVLGTRDTLFEQS